jgi:hypothetical protein
LRANFSAVVEWTPSSLLTTTAGDGVRHVQLGRAFHHVKVFAANEPSRVVTDRGYATAGRLPRHPLVE